MSGPAKDRDRSFGGFNLFLDQDYRLFLTSACGDGSITGRRAADLRTYLPNRSPGQASCLLKRLRTHGLIKKNRAALQILPHEDRSKSLGGDT